jgi:heat shock protein 4
VFQVREFKVEDISAFPIKMSWEGGANGEPADTKQMVAFASYTPIPCTKLLTFYRRSAFEIAASYADPDSLPAGSNAWIGNFTVNNVKPDPTGEPSTVKVKARLNPNGILEILGAQSVYEETVAVEEEVQAAAASKPEAANPKGEADPMETDGSSQPVSDENAAPASEPPAEAKDKKTKKVTKKTDLPVAGGTTSILKDKLLKLREQENTMAANDKLVFDTEERRNALEEYVYDMRGKLESDYAEFVQDSVIFTNTSLDIY